MPTPANHRDVTLTAHWDHVKVGCTHCPWEATITTAPYGVDLVRQARLEAFEHCWSEHKIHAWNVAFAVLG